MFLSRTRCRDGNWREQENKKRLLYFLVRTATEESIKTKGPVGISPNPLVTDVQPPQHLVFFCVCALPSLTLPEPLPILPLANRRLGGLVGIPSRRLTSGLTRLRLRLTGLPWSPNVGHSPVETSRLVGYPVSWTACRGRSER